MLAIALALSTFGQMIAGRHVRVWSDNTGSESSTKKGAAKAFDHNCLVHCLWLMAAKLQIDMFVDRVPSAENISDLPSREEYELLGALGAQFVSRHLAECFFQVTSWRALQLKIV